MLDGVFPGRNIDGRVYVMRGAGDGSFVDPVAITIGASTDWVEIADVDGDGVLDLALAVRANQGRVAVVRGLGGFNFEAPVLTVVGRDARSVAVGEAHANGRRDLFAMLTGEAALRALVPATGGTYEGLERRPLTPWAAGVSQPQWMGRADMNADGLPDLLTISTGSGSFSVLEGAGGTALDPTKSWRVPRVDGEVPGVSIGGIGDMNGDGAPDLSTAALCIVAPQSLIMMLNDRSGGFTPAPSVPVTFEGLAWAVAVGDLDLDGDFDAVLSTALPGAVHIIENLGSGTFAVSQSIGLGTFVRHVWIDDVDGDCKPDVITVDIATNRLNVLRNITPGLGGCGGLAEHALVLPIANSAELTAVDSARGEVLAARVALAAQSGAGAVMRALADFGIDAAMDMVSPGAAGGMGGLAEEYASCGPTGGGGACNEPHGLPGCFTTSCCNVVCEFDPHCCLETWDAPCVQLAQSLCAGLVCPSLGSCFEEHLSLGCDDEQCCEIVSRLDGFCGGAIWDEICVQEALRFCTVEPCTLPPPPPTSVDELEPCYKRFNQGCVGNTETSTHWIELSCGDQRHGTCSTGAPRDTDWFRIELAAPARLRFDVMAEFPARVLLIEGACDGPLLQIDDTSAWNCAPLSIDRCLPAGVYQLILGPGIPERVITNGQPCDLIDPDAPPPDPKAPPFEPGRYGLHWQAAISCLSCGNPGDVNGDGVVNGVDLAIILGSWGACPACPADLNDDGIVDGMDLAVVLGNWTG